MPKLTYKHDWKKIKERVLSSHQKEYKIGSVKDAVMHAIAERKMSNPYQLYEEMKEKGVTETRLHASVGSDLQSRGGHVLEFDLAGSGFKHFRARQAGIGGKNNYFKGSVEIPFEDIDRKKKWSVHWWNHLPSSIRNFLGLASIEDIRIQNEEIDRLYESDSKKNDAKQVSEKPVSDKSEVGKSDAEKTVSQKTVVIPEKTEKTAKENKDAVSAHSEKLDAAKANDRNVQNAEISEAKTKSEELIENRYGRHSELEGLKDKKYIYVKDRTVHRDDGTKVYRKRYSMPGSQATILGVDRWNGARNRGEYSIQKVSEYMLTAAQKYLVQIFDEWDKNQNRVKKEEDVAPITISIKGHSRGGVSAAHGAMMIQDWINKNYRRYQGQVKFNLVQLDPVAGFGSDHGAKSKINLVDEQRQDIRDELRDRDMSLLGKSAETTVVYSLHTDHRIFFSPQSVDGAKRIILTTAHHGVNLDAVDESQKAYGDKKAHREGYLDLASGEMYRGSGLNELPEGIYIADENNCLVKLPSLEAGRSIISEVLKNTSGQKERHNRIDAVMENWFKAREKEKEQDKEKDNEKDKEIDQDRDKKKEMEEDQGKYKEHESAAKKQEKREKIPLFQEAEHEKIQNVKRGKSGYRESKQKKLIEPKEKRPKEKV